MVTFLVPTSTNSVPIDIHPGSSLVLLGANGSGKTRLGVLIEKNIGTTTEVHRIAAHRSLTMNTKVQTPTFEIAERRLFYGSDQGTQNHKEGHRWQGQPATALLSDFDHLLTCLYAEENKVSVNHRQIHLKNPNAKAPITRFDKLVGIWNSLLPHRNLLVVDSDVKVQALNTELPYDARELSDGERNIFYLIGQVLLLRPNSIVIIDEPESHINRCILPKLWDTLESSRKDCTFIYLTHDIEFTNSRRAATKFVIHSYVKNSQKDYWDLELIPDNLELPEELIAKIAGSRLPVLFIEGSNASLDMALYQRIYMGFTVIPVGSCEAVIHSVTSLKKHCVFHRIHCAGLIDADGRDKDEIKQLESKNIYVLPVSEVENVLLLPEPFLELAKLQHFEDSECQSKLDELITKVLEEAQKNAEQYSTRYTRRRIDSAMKKIGLTSKTFSDLDSEFKTGVAKINASLLYTCALKEFNDAISKRDYSKVLRLYDNKGLLAAATILLGKNQKNMEEHICRVLPNEAGFPLLTALRNALPTINFQS